MGAKVEVDGTTARRTRRRLMAVALVTTVLGACAPTGGSAPGSYPDKATLEFVKRTEFYDRARNEADRIAAGVAQPILEFTVEGSPPSVFVNWIIPDAQAAAFSSFVALPPGFSLAKVRIIESDPVQRYWLSLNVYRVSGLTTGLRAEWSTYVDDGSGVPRFMIIRARAAEGSLDPLGPIAQPEPFSHGVTGGAILTAMNKTVLVDGVPVVTGDNLFNSSITLPAPVDRNYVVPTREWVTANDFIYWLNGVNDRIFHNSTSHSAPLISVDLGDVVLDDDSEWAPFVDPVPGHVLVYLDRIQFMIGPWWNVTEPDGRVDPGTRATLLDYKKPLYGNLASLLALGVLAGTAEPVVLSSVADTPPAVYWHWRIPAGNLAAFAAAANAPPWLTLTPVKLQEGDATADHWLTLKVDRDPGTNAGLRAEWSTYVSDAGKIRTLILESRSAFTSLNPITLATPPSPISHAIAGSTVTTTVGSGPTAFSSSFVVPVVAPATSILASREWVGSSDLRYWMSGIADRVFYDASVFEAKTSVDPGGVSVTDGGPWAAFVAGGPDRVWVDRSETDLVTNPWWNLSFF